MKGVLKTVTLSGKNYDIKKEGASLAIECQSIFSKIIRDNDISLDKDIETIDMLSSMTRDIVARIKYVFIECIASPKMTEDSFEELKPSIIPRLFMLVYDYQTREAEDKKKEPSESTDSQMNSEKKN